MSNPVNSISLQMETKCSEKASIFLRVVSLCLFTFLYSNCCLAQVEVTREFLMDNTIEIDSNYIAIIQRPDGWKSYAKYVFETDSLSIDSSLNSVRYLKSGIAEHDSPKVSYVMKYKIRDNSICYKMTRADFKATKRKGNIKGRYKWGSHKLIKVTPKYYIVDTGVSRMIYLSK